MAYENPSVPDDLPPVTPDTPVKRVGDIPAKQPSENFKDYMQRIEPTATSGGEKISPFDLAQQKPIQEMPNSENVREKAEELHNDFSGIKEQLNDKNLKLKTSQQHILKNHLEEANRQLRLATKTAGADGTGPHKADKHPDGAVEKFLGYVANGQNMIASTSRRMAELGNDPTKANPAQYLEIQTQMARAQQSLEMTSVALANFISGFKMLMSTQL